MGVIDDLLGKKPEIRKVPIPLDPEAAERYAEASARHNRAQRAAKRSPLDDEAQEELEGAREARDTARQEVERSLARFTFRSVSPVEFEELKARCRPTEQQRTDYRKAGKPVPEWNPDTFQPALVATACVEVRTAQGTQAGLSEEDALKLWASEKWNAGLRNELFGAALSAYINFTGVDLGKD